MDDKADGTYARAPEIKDVLNLCRSLNECGADYILVGGFAVIFHGFGRTTKDIDFLVGTSKANVQKIKQALSILQDNAIQELEDDEIEKYVVVRVADEIVVDLMAKACSIDFEEAKKEIQYLEIENVKIPIASKELLIRMKDTVRPSDKMDVEYLKAALAYQKKNP